MTKSWKGLLTGVAATVGTLVVGAVVLTSAVSAQTPTATPAASPAASPSAPMPGTPPMRVFGTAQLNGMNAAAGTAVVATIGSATCGTGQVSATGTYVLDVNSAATQAGCGTDGATVNFTVGGARATQTATWRQGAFTEVNLTATSATATPAPTATAGVDEQHEHLETLVLR